jgi:homocysteine S-methyltransferase
MVTDGGMETDMIFHHGVDLPLFAAFPLVDSPGGRSLLTGYWTCHSGNVACQRGPRRAVRLLTWTASR